MKRQNPCRPLDKKEGEDGDMERESAGATERRSRERR